MLVHTCESKVLESRITVQVQPKQKSIRPYLKNKANHGNPRLSSQLLRRQFKEDLGPKLTQTKVQDPI
jgi:hypothetical protein